MNKKKKNKLKKKNNMKQKRNTQNLLDIVLIRGSHISQIALVFLAIFGYFYTVRPIFQKEVLSEEIAKMQKNGKQLRTTLINIQKQVKQAYQNIYYDKLLQEIVFQYNFHRIKNDEKYVSDLLDRKINENQPFLTSYSVFESAITSIENNVSVNRMIPSDELSKLNSITHSRLNRYNGISNPKESIKKIILDFEKDSLNQNGTFKVKKKYIKIIQLANINEMMRALSLLENLRKLSLDV
jgi:hypothetical protein